MRSQDLGILAIHVPHVAVAIGFTVVAEGDRFHAAPLGPVEHVGYQRALSAEEPVDVALPRISVIVAVEAEPFSDLRIE